MEGDLSTPENYGIIPRSAQLMFEEMKKPEYVSHSIVVTSLEIYNEELCDLFADADVNKIKSPTKGSKLEIMEGRNGVVCRGLTEKKVESTADIFAALETAQRQRKVSDTNMNMKSSRSHCVFTMRLTAKRKLSNGKVFETHGKLHLVDLAGSECAKAASFSANKSNAMTDSITKKEVSIANRNRGRERSNINKSLLTLGRVIIMLNLQSNGSNKHSHVRIPYRDSKLTRILQDSLGGNCKTMIIATVSPSEMAIDETISTLSYAQSAGGIINKPTSESYLRSPDLKYMAPTKNPIDKQGIEHWYVMENRVEYLQSQLDEAQAALARQYAGQENVRLRATRAEYELMETKKKLQTTEKNLKKSLKVLQHTKVIITAQQDQVKSSKVQQKRLQKHAVENVLKGVKLLTDGHVEEMSTIQKENLEVIGKKNRIMLDDVDGLGSSANHVLCEITKANNSIKKHTDARILKDSEMVVTAEKSDAMISDLDKAWNLQLKMVDSFVVEAKNEAQALSTHENTITSISDTLQSDHVQCKRHVKDTLSDSMGQGLSELLNIVNSHTQYSRKTVLPRTHMNLEQIKEANGNYMSTISRTNENTFVSIFEDKENVAAIANRHCILADKLKDDIESRYNKFDNVVAERRSLLDIRKEENVHIMNEFKKLTTDTILSTESLASVSLDNAQEFASHTINPWVESSIPTREQIVYESNLSSTPSEDIILANVIEN
jgi:kinesin family protein 11